MDSSQYVKMIWIIWTLVLSLRCLFQLFLSLLIAKRVLSLLDLLVVAIQTCVQIVQANIWMDNSINNEYITYYIYIANIGNETNQVKFCEDIKFAIY